MCKHRFFSPIGYQLGVFSRGIDLTVLQSKNEMILTGHVQEGSEIEGDLDVLCLTKKLVMPLREVTYESRGGKSLEYSFLHVDH